MSFESPTRLEKIAFRIEWNLSGPLIAPYLKGLGLQGDETVLEVGCGGGAVTRHLARLLPHGRVIGVDPSAYWVEHARGRLRRVRNVALFVGDVLSADISPESLDAALFHYVLHDIPAADRPTTLARIEELLKPGGRLFLREPTREAHGMRPDKIRGLLSSVGLREEQAHEKKAFLLGAQLHGIFRKV
ncbi:MAG: class I SAM-dependent methyltransferase [Candidatus Bipolaricaulia bacterium]